MTMASFLLDSHQSHAREEILNHLLLFDLKVAAAESDYHLQNYHSDVDHEGCDVIIDDGINLKKIQLKSVGKDAKTAKWEIHRGLMRPTANNLEPLGFQFKSPFFDEGRVCWGMEGGVILIEYTVDGLNINPTYYYTDVFIVTAISLGILSRPRPTVTVADTFRKQLPQQKTNSKIDVKKGVFVRAETPMNLLCLSGMQSTLPSNWQMKVLALANEEWGSKGQVIESKLEEYRNGFQAQMCKICGHGSP